MPWKGLTAAREQIPDYTSTLGEMAADLKALQDALERIEQCPAFALTPAALAMEIVKARGRCAGGGCAQA